MRRPQNSSGGVTAGNASRGAQHALWGGRRPPLRSLEEQGGEDLERAVNYQHSAFRAFLPKADRRLLKAIVIHGFFFRLAEFIPSEIQGFFATLGMTNESARMTTEGLSGRVTRI